MIFSTACSQRLPLLTWAAQWLILMWLGAPRSHESWGDKRGCPAAAPDTSPESVLAHGHVMNSWSKGYGGRGGNPLIITFKLLTFHTLTVFGQLRKTDIGAFNLTISVLTVTSGPWLLHLLSLAITFFNKNNTVKMHAQYQNDCSYGALYVQPSENSKPSVKSKHTMRKLKIIEQWKGSGTHQIPTTRRMMVRAYGGPTCRQDTARLPRLRPSADNPLSGRRYSAERSLSLYLSKQCSRTLGHPGRGHRLCSRPITVASHQLPWMPRASLHPQNSSSRLTSHPHPCFLLCFRAKTQLLSYLLLKLYHIS